MLFALKYKQNKSCSIMPAHPRPDEVMFAQGFNMVKSQNVSSEKRLLVIFIILSPTWGFWSF